MKPPLNENIKVLKKLNDAYTKHENFDYNTHWYKFETITLKSLIPLLDRKLKVRLYDFYLTDITYASYFRTIVFKSKTIDDHKLKPIELLYGEPLINDLLFSFVLNHIPMLLRIYHVYQTEDYTVLYSIPDARTIVQAYNNNPIIADEKLAKLCPNKILRNKILKSAFDIAN